jgi:hypothetical protein
MRYSPVIMRITVPLFHRISPDLPRGNATNSPKLL